MSTCKALSKRAIILALSLSAAACASAPPPQSSLMALAGPAPVPRGFVAFCQRRPAECEAAPGELEALVASLTPRPAPAQDAPARVIKADWTPSATLRPAYDWNSLFAKVATLPSPAAPAAVTQAVAAPPPAPAPAEALPALTPEFWNLITRTNDRVNRAIAQRSDLKTFGVSNVWTIPLEDGLTAGDCKDFALEKRHQLVAAGVSPRALSLAVVTTTEGGTHAVLLVATDNGEFVLDNLSAWVLPWSQTPYRFRERQVAGSAVHWAMAAEPTTSTPASSGADPRQSRGKLLFASLR